MLFCDVNDLAGRGRGGIRMNFVSDKRVIKKPWKPEKGEWYWRATYCGISSIRGASTRQWNDEMSDLAYYAVGNCFRTQEEAEKHKDEVLAKLKEVYDSGKPLI